ncbi:DASH complex subunit Dad2 [Ceraceosorus bombacis]|uniref:DASH complex subunit DAD2 n=1 Tax=Ceraceosorus bombacis TaxID=401625 RepID=A0A0P1BRB3_9BASI|nr:DASH complex subunit Dad2 [Ceraceosorus bombacis]
MSRQSGAQSARGSVYAPVPMSQGAPPGGSLGASASHFQASSSATGPAPTGAAARLAAKQAELAGLRQLKEQSARLARDVQALGDGVDSLVNGGDAVAAVLSSWQGVFRAIQLAQGLADTEETPGTATGTSFEAALPDTLVRIPVDGPGAEASAAEDNSAREE